MLGKHDLGKGSKLISSTVVVLGPWFFGFPWFCARGIHVMEPLKGWEELYCNVPGVKRKILSGLWSSSIMDLEPRGKYSILRDKKQTFGAYLVNFTHAIGVLHEVLQEAMCCYWSDTAC